MFRFRLDDIDRLCAALHLPDTMRAPNRTCWSGREGLCILLNRHVYPSRLATLMRTFGRGRSEMSLIINCTLDFLYAEWNHLLVDINQPWMTHDRLESYCEAVVRRGSPLTNIIEFVDGTGRSICRPISCIAPPPKKKNARYAPNLGNKLICPDRFFFFGLFSHYLFIFDRY